MTVTAIVGAQWGDEGKGRVVDYLAQRADMVIRFQGGDNAGHTVVNHYGTFRLHIVPSGIFNPKTRCIVGAGTVVNPIGLQQELRELEQAGVDTRNLWLSERAHVIFEVHRQLDGLEELARSGRSLGTTKRGIGPTYADRAARHGIRLGDLKRPDYLRERLQGFLHSKNALLKLHDQPPLELASVFDTASQWGEQLGPRIVDTLPLTKAAVQGDEAVILEGQLGAMRDLDWGTYPYVTSSNPMVGAACSGAGLPPSAIDHVIGVVKAYSTAVGAGPFPCELHDADGERLREAGLEYGATTGRPRRCGWLDVVAARHGAWLNGFTSLAITKLDVLDELESIRVGIGYTLPDTGDQVHQSVPDTADYEHAKPVYETLPGWQALTREARVWRDLPLAAQSYLRRIEALIGVPIEFISVGPARDELIVLPHGGTRNA